MWVGFLMVLMAIIIAAGGWFARWQQAQQRVHRLQDVIDSAKNIEDYEKAAGVPDEIIKDDGDEIWVYREETAWFYVHYDPATGKVIEMWVRNFGQ